MCDIVRVDHRKNKARIEFLEVKSGSHNLLLSEYLDRLIVSPESISLIQKCEVLPEKDRKQGARMMRQRLRLKQAKELIETDKGIDPALQQKMYISKQTQIIDEYDEVIDDLCTHTPDEGISGTTVDYCLHICVAKGSSVIEIRKRALSAVSQLWLTLWKDNPEIAKIAEQLKKQVPISQFWMLIDPISFNLFNGPVRPLLMWRIARPYLYDMLAGRIALVIVFDLPGFLFAAQDVGFVTGLSSRKETDDTRKKFGSHNVLTWGNRMIYIDRGDVKETLLSGTFGRFFANLQSPRAVLGAYKTSDLPKEPVD